MPKNNAMQANVRRIEGKGDKGEEGNKKIGELNGLNGIRLFLSGIAYGISLVQMSP